MNKKNGSVMKQFRFYLLAFVLLCGALMDISAQERKTKKQKKQEQFQETVALVESGNFIFEARRAFPLGGSSVDLTTNYGFLKVNDSIAVADLPYFGRAYRAQYGRNGGMEFSGEMKNINVSKRPEKMDVTFSFEVKDNDLFRVTMNIGYNGDTSLDIVSNDRSFIRYSGDISAPESEESE
jgi:hypothetical protein